MDVHFFWGLDREKQKMHCQKPSHNTYAWLKAELNLKRLHTSNTAVTLFKFKRLWDWRNALMLGIQTDFVSPLSCSVSLQITQRGEANSEAICKQMSCILQFKVGGGNLIYILGHTSL